MKKNYGEEQIIKILAELEAGSTVAQISRNHGVHANTLYKWRQKYAGMTVSDVHRLRSLEDENRRLKQIVADQALDIVVLKEITKSTQARNEEDGDQRGHRTVRA